MIGIESLVGFLGENTEFSESFVERAAEEQPFSSSFGKSDTAEKMSEVKRPEAEQPFSRSFTESAEEVAGTEEDYLCRPEDEQPFSPSSMNDENIGEIRIEVQTDEGLMKTDDNGDVYLKNGQLLPNTTYELNGNNYSTDDHGRITSSVAQPSRNPENQRTVDAQVQVGGEDRRPNDQGGHIVGRDLNGDGGIGNLIPMDSGINQSDYKKMENDIKKALDAGKNVTVFTELKYSGDSKRPDIINATVYSDGLKTVYKFDNNIDGGLRGKFSESGLEAVQKELNKTNGEISSIKEEYDENGKLTKTTVNIKYVNESGDIQRTKVVFTE